MVPIDYCLFCFAFVFEGEAHSLKVEKILFKRKSEYQEILVFEVCRNGTYPKVFKRWKL